MTLASCLYDGMVRHRRFEPIEHGFRVRLQLLYLDLEELASGALEAALAGSRLWSIGGRTPVSFRRADHLGGDGTDLAATVARLVEERTGRPPRGPIRLLTSPRYLGLGFNPVSFYYCLDEHGASVDTLVAEVTNTPWSEHHCYVVDLAGGDREKAGEAGPSAARTDKVFHVSPFMGMEMTYDWRVTPPARSLTLSIRNERSDTPPAAQREYGAPYFQADLALSRRELAPDVLRRAFLAQPFLSGRVLLGIYRQALRLWLRRVPYKPHPAERWPRRLDDPSLWTAPGEPRGAAAPPRPEVATP